MKHRALELLACPDCAGELRVSRVEAQDETAGEILDGQLKCSACAAEFPIVRSIPRFVPASSYADSFGYQWNQFRHLQLDKVMQNNLSQERFYATTGWPPEMAGQRILEAGCGAGRFTEIAQQAGAEIFSFDLSSAVEANSSNIGRAPNVHIFQANIYRIPLRRTSFDKIFCMGVLQHCPDVKRAFLGLVPYLKDGGEIVVDCYLRNGWIPPLKYWVRPFVKHLSPRALHRLLRLTIPPLFDLKKALSKIPVAGKPVSELIPIGPISHAPRANYTDEQLKEIKILSAFDMLSPAHDHPQRQESLREWFEEAGLVDVQVKLGFNGINAKGRKPEPLHDQPPRPA